MVDFIGAARDPQFRQDVGQGLVDAFGRGLAMVGGAPVDLTTMFLRPLGYSAPDEQIVGSSEYIGRQMANLGLISETRNPAAEFLSALLIPDPTDIQKLAPYVQRAMNADLVAARPSTPGAAMRAQRGSVGVEKTVQIGANKQRDMSIEEYKDVMLDFAKKIKDKLKDGQNLYVRWSPTAERDLLKESRSRDFVSGQTHEGLSAVEISPESSIEEIASSLSEYGFIRMQDPLSVPRVYSGERVGTDSDYHALIRPKNVEFEIPKNVLRAIDSQVSDLIKIDSDIKDAKMRLEKINDPIGKKIVSERIEELNKSRMKLINQRPQAQRGSVGVEPVSEGSPQAPREEALRIAQENAAKPVSEGGLGLPPDNTAMDRARAMGFETAPKKRLYHGSRGGIVGEIDPSKSDFGFHAGTLEQAERRLKARSNLGETWPEGATVLPLMKQKYADMLKVKDEGSFRADVIAPQLAKKGIISKELAKKIVSDIESGFDREKIKAYDELLRKAMREQDYQGISYSNIQEGPGTSYAFIDPSVLRLPSAAFDPARRYESDLLGSVDPRLLAILGPATAAAVYGLGELYANQRRDEQTR